MQKIFASLGPIKTMVVGPLRVTCTIWYLRAIEIVITFCNTRGIINNYKPFKCPFYDIVVNKGERKVLEVIIKEKCLPHSKVFGWYASKEL